MKRNYPIKDLEPRFDGKENYYVTYANAGKQTINQEVLENINQGADNYGLSEANRNLDYRNLTPYASSRPGLTRGDYDVFRPDERIPTKYKDVFRFSQRIYDKVGLIKNIIDLMSDFGSQGIRLVHKDKNLEIFYRNWFNKVRGAERSERFLNNFYRLGNVIMKRNTAFISRKYRATLMKSQGKADKKVEEIDIARSEIPWDYLFLNPATVDLLNEELACFSGKKRYVLKLNNKLNNKFQFNQKLSDAEKEMIKDIPKDMYSSLQSRGIYELPPDKTIVYHYKKDDWQPWAYPMTYAILDDILLLEKLKLADLAALDGAISNIRIFKLGSLDPLLVPGPALHSKLRNILSSHTAAGTIDLVWGPDIELVESKTEVYKFLGQEKYIPTLNSIYGGIGIPPTLTGSFSAEGTTNNYMSLKTLIQRLEYGRQMLTEFWMNEVRLVQKAMNHAEPPQVEYDFMDLGDSDTEKNLILNMSDRGLVSDELVQRRFGHNVEIEEARINRENKQRTDSVRPHKAGPYYEGQPDHKMQQIALQKGFISPKDVGVQGTPIIPPGTLNKKGNKTPFQGRPKGSKDKAKRKTKTFTPKSKASLEIWAADAQVRIAEVINPYILQAYSKKNMRSLTQEQVDASEKVKFGVLFKLEPFTTLTDKNIIGAFNKSQDIPSYVDKTYSGLKNEVSNSLGRQLTFDELRKVQQYLYGEVYEN